LVSGTIDQRGTAVGGDAVAAVAAAVAVGELRSVDSTPAATAAATNASLRTRSGYVGMLAVGGVGSLRA
jgi:hypothetical protein